MTGMTGNPYTEGYYLRGEGSNYHDYTDDPGWPATVAALGLTPAQALAVPLLELGAATGWFVHHARAHGYSAVGIDVSRWATSHAAPYARGRLVCGDVRDLGPADFPAFQDPVGLPWFRFVCSWEFLEHVPAEDVGDVLARAWDMLDPVGGVFVHRIGIDVVGDGETDRSSHFADATHETFWPREKWEALISALPGATWQPGLEERLDAMHAGRDWAGRFFAWSKR